VYSRDSRPDCKQVCIGLVVTRDGYPLGYEVFDGNRVDVTTVEEIVEAMETRYGRAGRIWVMDRGMVSEDNLAWLRVDLQQLQRLVDPLYEPDPLRHRLDRADPAHLHAPRPSRHLVAGIRPLKDRPLGRRKVARLQPTTNSALALSELSGILGIHLKRPLCPGRCCVEKLRFTRTEGRFWLLGERRCRRSRLIRD
jgi:hypothetical protein